MKERYKFWIDFINKRKLKVICEIGVYRGQFALALLENCPCITQYIMIDAWRYLPEYFGRKTKNDDVWLNAYMHETMSVTQPWVEKRTVYPMESSLAFQDMRKNFIDLAYIDASHTMRGIATDLIGVAPLVKPGGYICGDDCCEYVKWKRKHQEPVLVYPFVLYFAEAMGFPLWIGEQLNQFIIEKGGVVIHNNKHHRDNFKDYFRVRTVLYHWLLSALPKIFSTIMHKMKRRDLFNSVKRKVKSYVKP